MSHQENSYPACVSLTSVPLSTQEQHILARRDEIEQWFSERWAASKTIPPFYTSVDLRYSGYKLAAVDTNVFPAGFNNLACELSAYGVSAIKTTLSARFPNARSVLLIPESHTRNVPYWHHIARLVAWFREAGYDVVVGGLFTELTRPKSLNLPGAHEGTAVEVVVHPITRQDDKLVAAGLSADIIVLNHDLSGGVPELLQELSQPIIPRLSLGWHQRSKYKHVQQYERVCQAFASAFDWDPWFFLPQSRYCGEVDFISGSGRSCLVAQVDALLSDIRVKYAEQGIKDEPFVVVKSDAGTYGMGVMMVTDAAQIEQLNRKQRLKMASGKGGVAVSRVLIQEGVRTIEYYGAQLHVAEPVIYMIGSQVVGGFYRVHAQRGGADNLNAPGMEFIPMTLGEDNGRFFVYSVVARLGLLGV